MPAMTRTPQRMAAAFARRCKNTISSSFVVSDVARLSRLPPGICHFSPIDELHDATTASSVTITLGLISSIPSPLPFAHLRRCKNYRDMTISRAADVTRFVVSRCVTFLTELIYRPPMADGAGVSLILPRRHGHIRYKTRISGRRPVQCRPLVAATMRTTAKAATSCLGKAMMKMYRDAPGRSPENGRAPYQH